MMPEMQASMNHIFPGMDQSSILISHNGKATDFFPRNKYSGVLVHPEAEPPAEPPYDKKSFKNPPYKIIAETGQVL